MTNKNNYFQENHYKAAAKCFGLDQKIILNFYIINKTVFHFDNFVERPKRTCKLNTKLDALFKLSYISCCNHFKYLSVSSSHKKQSLHCLLLGSPISPSLVFVNKNKTISLRDFPCFLVLICTFDYVPIMEMKRCRLRIFHIFQVLIKEHSKCSFEISI